MPYGIILLLAITLATQGGDKKCLVGRGKRAKFAPDSGAELSSVFINSWHPCLWVWLPRQLHVASILTHAALAQVFDVIILLVSIDMINSAYRPPTLAYCPYGYVISNINVYTIDPWSYPNVFNIRPTHLL